MIESEGLQGKDVDLLARPELGLVQIERVESTCRRRLSEVFKSTSAIFPILREHCIWRTTRAGDTLDQLLRSEQSLKGKHQDIALFWAPMTSLIRTPWSQFTLFAMSMYLAYVAAGVCMGFWHYGHRNFKAIRLEIIGDQIDSSPLHAQNATAAAAQIELRLLYQGCEVFSRTVREEEARNHVGAQMSELNSTLEFDGFSIAHSSGGAKYLLHGSNDDGQTWTAAGSSEFRYVASGLRLNRCAQPGRTSTFDFRPPWPLFEESVINPLIMAIGCLGAALWGLSGMHRMTDMGLIFLCMVLGVNNLVAGIGYQFLGKKEESFLPFTSLLICILVSVSAMVAKRNFIDEPPLFSYCIIVVGFAFIALRHRFLMNALRSVICDRKLYDAKWARIERDPAMRHDLKVLEEVASKMAADCSSKEARHFVEAGDDYPLSNAWTLHWSLKAWHSHEKGRSAGETCPWDRVSNPVTCLDQLYSQALGLVDLLHSQCTEWAAASRGSLENSVSQTDFEVSCTNMHLVPSFLGKWVKLRFIKAPSRAVEKAIVCYSGDVSRLADICRCRIIFDNVGDLISCLQIIQEQSEAINIVRIKNRMLLGSDSYHAAGYRAVILNLCLDTNEARVLGLHRHVCELQLVLRPLISNEDACQQLEAHGRYLTFRRVRTYAHVFHIDRFQHEQPKTSSEIALSGQRKFSAEFSLRSKLHATGDIESPRSKPAWDRQQSTRATHHFLSATPSSGSYCEAGGASSQSYETYVFYNEYLKSVSYAGGYYNRSAQRLQEAFALSSAGSAWFSRKPFAAAATKPISLVLQAVVVVYFVFRGINRVSVLQRPSSFQADTVRFTVLGLRDTSLPPDYANVTSFGLLKDGCKLNPITAKLERSGDKFVMHLDRTIEANGYYFVTSDSQIDHDPVRWIVEAKTNSSTWQQVGKNQFLPFLTPDSRNIQVDFDSRQSWPLIIMMMVGTFETAFGFFCCMIAAITGKVYWVKRIIVFCSTLIAFGLIAAAIGFHSHGNLQSAASVWLTNGAMGILIIGIAFFEEHVVSILLVYSLAQAAITIMLYVMVFNMGLGQVLGNLLCSPASATFFYGSTVIFFRKRVLFRAHSLLLRDKVKYDEVWTKIMIDADRQTAIEQLQVEVQAISSACPRDVPRQYNRMRTVPCTEDHDCLGIPGTIDLQNPVMSLDQLFVQASCLHHILLTKVKDWASSCEGYFPMASSPGFVRYHDVRHDQDAHLKFCKVKSVSRAIEKVYRSYRQDVSRLTDLCRQSIVFQSVNGIVECLRCIQADAEVQIVRIKNRYDPGYDANSSSGYRDVGINLRIVGANACALGVENHVCELQLLLMQFAELKTAPHVCSTKTHGSLRLAAHWTPLADDGRHCPVAAIGAGRRGAQALHHLPQPPRRVTVCLARRVLGSVGSTEESSLCVYGTFTEAVIVEACTQVCGSAAGERLLTKPDNLWWTGRLWINNAKQAEATATLDVP